MSIQGYRKVHLLLYKDRGSAHQHECAHCGDSADQWAYTNNCPNEQMIGGKGSGRNTRYSDDPERYIALCIPCHRAFDGKAPLSRAAADLRRPRSTLAR